MNKATFAGSNLSLVKAHNLRAVLLSLLHHGPISRVQLAQQTELSGTTITNITTQLLTEGVIAEKEQADLPAKNGRRRVGRPRRMLSLVPNARFVIGVHVGIGLYRVAVTNLCADVIHGQTVHFSLDTPPQTLLARIAETVKEVSTAVNRQTLIGVGVGVSGLVDHKTGVNVLAPSLGWQDVPVAEVLSSHLDIPIAVDNNVRTMALGEAFFGAGQTAEVLAFIYGRYGVGAGFVVNGQLYRGSGAGAGEIGHTIIHPDKGQRCRCGQTGCLETLVSEPVLIEAAKQLAQQVPDSLLAQSYPQDIASFDWLLNAARQGDPTACTLFQNRARYLGIALANLVNILNPELILLGGLFAQAHDLMLPTIETTIQQTAFAGLGQNVRLQTTSFDWQAGVIGAASLALTNFFYQQETL